MVVPFLEDELSDLLETNVSSLNSTNLKVGAFQDSPNTQVVLFNLGAETERRYRFRTMVRADDYQEAMLLANEVYDYLQRLYNVDLTTVKLYMVTGQRPQQSGRDESGRYLVAADFLMEFELL